MYGEAKIYIGTIIEVDKSKVRVEYTNTKSDFVPYLQVSNAFKTHYSPPQVGEVVILFKLDNTGFVIGSIFPQSAYSHLQENTESINYADGTSICYQDGALQVKSLKQLNIVCKKATINAESITLGGESASDLGGVVTGECICPFTGSPHAEFSKKVKALK
ncbi:hypothetical protein [Helicobacter japonicus]|uniref:hypothetical protein n=1 Tax=Helicobacter japonicus TaxID=425400 RepID=UPI0025DF469A|nr:hypothetical protein [Helicobacter japonicus]